MSNRLITFRSSFAVGYCEPVQYIDWWLMRFAMPKQGAAKPLPDARRVLRSIYSVYLVFSYVQVRSDTVIIYYIDTLSAGWLATWLELSTLYTHGLDTSVLAFPKLCLCSCFLWMTWCAEAVACWSIQTKESSLFGCAGLSSFPLLPLPFPLQSLGRTLRRWKLTVW